MITRGEGWFPVDASPVGLVTWFAPTGEAVAVLASWLAVINGQPPELRAGCSGRGWERQLPAGMDFAVNVFAELPMPPLWGPEQGAAGSLVLDASLPLFTARLAHAPLLAGCALQIECAHGRLLPGDWEPELAGDILLLHRGGLIFDPADVRDFCALLPLRTILHS